MTDLHFSVDDAIARMAAGEEIAVKAHRATRWFKWFVFLQAAFALAFTLSIDVATVPYWNAFALWLLATLSLWSTASLHRRSAPRNGLRNMGTAVATWFALYTLMFDPALQLVGASSPWWWVLAGVIAISPILACFPASSRK